MQVSIGVVGLGRIAQTIIRPLIEREDFSPSQIFGVVGHEESVSKALDQVPNGVQVVSADDPISKEVWSAPIILLAIKPQQLSTLEDKFRQAPIRTKGSGSILISVLAGVKLERLAKTFSGYSCIRAVPNIPVLVGAGLTGLAFSGEVDADQKESVEKIFSPISEVFNLPEEQLDAFLALTSSGPAYVALIAEALADGAVAAGLPRSIANTLSYNTLFGTSLLLKEKELHPGQLKDMVASPGGTTITALRHLEKAGIRSALIEAVVSAAERSRELA